MFYWYFNARVIFGLVSIYIIFNNSPNRALLDEVVRSPLTVFVRSLGQGETKQEEKPSYEDSKVTNKG